MASSQATGKTKKQQNFRQSPTLPQRIAYYDPYAFLISALVGDRFAADGGGGDGVVATCSFNLSALAISLLTNISKSISCEPCESDAQTNYPPRSSGINFRLDLKLGSLRPPSQSVLVRCWTGLTLSLLSSCPKTERCRELKPVPSIGRHVHETYLRSSL